MPIITLLSDFGLEDGYVAAMKGVIAGFAPEAGLVDITHLVPPQDVAFGRFRLLTAAPYFPAGTVHLAVVDPGVGTARRAVAVQSRSGSWFVGPDNGLLLGALDADPPVAAVELTDPGAWRTTTPSATFHGRDIFAPVAARLARGMALEALGSGVAPASLVRLELRPWVKIAGGVRGSVQAVDRFGNLITNIPETLLDGHRVWLATTAGHVLPGHRTYGEVAAGKALALVGSHGFVEVAVHHGEARRVLGVGVGDPVEVSWPESSKRESRVQRLGGRRSRK
jgi:S-adenosyl-L-methionine hydrolase (adenosine-forming)